MSADPSKRAAVFFDRDGVVNRSPGQGYVTAWEEFEFCEGIGEVLALCRGRGYLLVLVTSQRCVGKGLLSLQDLCEIHEKMQQSLGEEAQFDAVYAFTGLPGSEHLEKPNPGLVLEAAAELGIAVEDSWLVGDADRDILMAQAAGIGTTVRVRSHHTIGVDADTTVDSAVELLQLLDGQLPSL